MNKKIEDALNYWKNRLFEEYGEKHILNIALYGSQNYDIDTPKSDIDVKAIYVPSYKEAILQSSRISKELHNDENEHCEIKDVREMIKMYKKQNINFLETLFTEYRYDNPLYKDINNKLKDKAETIARYNVKDAIYSICGQAEHAIKSLKNKSIPNSLIETEKDLKALVKVIYFYLFLNKYITGQKYEDCLKVSDNEEFLNYKAKTLLLDLKSDKRVFDIFPTLNKYFENKKIENVIELLYNYFLYMRPSSNDIYPNINNIYIDNFFDEIIIDAININSLD